jgi:hypothetical protein
MAWDLIGVSTYAEVTSGNLTLNAPAGIAEGDLLVACIAYRSNVAFTLPAGWNLVATQQSSGDTDATQGIASGVMAWIIRGASNPSFVFTRTGGDVAQGTILAYRGHALSPYDTGGAATLGTIGEPSLAAISTAQAGELLVAMVSSGDNSSMSAFDATDPSTASGGTDTTTDPTTGTWIERFDRGSNSGADTGLAVADAVKSGSGSTGTLSADASATTRSVFIVGAFKQQFSYSMTMAGGGLGGGSAVLVNGGVLSGSGGAISGGSASMAKGVAIAASGGGISGGAATIEVAHSISVTGSGGALAGGTADYAFEQGSNSYSMIMDGGGLAGGAAAIALQQVFTVSGSGGGVCGGEPSIAFQQSLSLGMVGGGIGGGAVSPVYSFAGSMSGGGICGGEAGFVSSDYVELYPSDHIPAGGGTATTFRLTAPLGKSGTDFEAGKISDDTNPLGGLDLGSDKFTELEWSLIVNSWAAQGDEFEFRITDNGSPLNAYAQTPKATVAVSNSLEVDMQGGGIAGGEAALQKSLVYAGAGGGIAGGAAEIAAESTLSFQMAGGGVSGGTAEQVFEALLSGAGGAIAGGTAAEIASAILAMAGGAIAGGAATIQTSSGMVVTMAGGAVAGGASDQRQQRLMVLQGGAVVGGAAECGGTLGRSVVVRRGKGGGNIERMVNMERLEREAEERLILATIKMFLENEDRWAA